MFRFMKHTGKASRRWLIISAVAIAILAPAHRLGAQGGGVVSAPIVENLLANWEALQNKQWYQNMAKYADQLATLEQSLETAREYTSVAKRAYGYLKAVSTGYENIESLYRSGKNLYDYTVYAYNYTRSALSDGRIRARDAARIWHMLDYTNRQAYNVTKSIADIFFNQDENNPITFKMKIDALEKARLQLMMLAADVATELKNAEENADAEASRVALEELVSTAYGPGGKKNSDPEQTALSTMKEAVKNSSPSNAAAAKKLQAEFNNARQDENTISDSGKSASETGKIVVGWGKAILNIISMLVGFIGAFLMLTASVRMGRDQQQAKDALFKIIEATIIFILAVQIFGRILFGIVAS